MGTSRRTPLVRGRGAGIAVALSAALTLAACAGDSGSGEDSDTYKIGALLDLSQTYKFIGSPTLAGLRTAVDEVNEDGGVNGKEIELIVQDNRADAPTARSAFQELDREGVLALVGPNNSATLVPTAPLATQLKVPILSIAAVPDLQGEANPFLYATGLPVAQSAKIDAKWISDQGVANPRVAALSIDTPSLAEFRSTLETAVPEIGGTLVANDVVAIDATDMTNAALPIAEKKPDFVPVGLLGGQLPGFLSSLRDRGVDAPVMNYFVASDDATFEAVGDDNFYAVRHFAEPTDTENPGVGRMAEAAEAAGQTEAMTNSYFTHGYVVGKLLFAAIEECGEDCDAESMDEALSSIRDFETDGLSGPLGVTEDDHYFVKYGQVIGWDAETETTETLGDWVSGD